MILLFERKKKYIKALIVMKNIVTRSVGTKTVDVMLKIAPSMVSCFEIQTIQKEIGLWYVIIDSNRYTILFLT